MNLTRKLIGGRTVAGIAAVVALSAGLIFAGTPAPASANAAPSLAPAKVCYDVADAGGGWLADLACNGTLVTPTGGLYGLAVGVSGGNNTPSVYYSAYFGGKWVDGQNLDRVGGLSNVITAVSITISPRAGRNLCYSVLDSNFTQYNACNGTAVGSTAATAPALRSILITYSG